MGEDSAVEEFTIAVNGPCLAHADSAVEEAMNQGGIKYFTLWEPVLSAKNFAQNSVSQTRQKTSKIVVIWVFLPMKRKGA